MNLESIDPIKPSHNKDEKNDIKIDKQELKRLKRIEHRAKRKEDRKQKKQQERIQNLEISVINSDSSTNQHNKNSETKENKNIPDNDDSHLYACSLCGTNVMKLPHLLAAHPQRRSDGCFIVRPSKVIHESIIHVLEDDNSNNYVVFIERYNTPITQIESSIEIQPSFSKTKHHKSKINDSNIKVVEPRIRYKCTICNSILFYQVIGRKWTQKETKTNQNFDNLLNSLSEYPLTPKQENFIADAITLVENPEKNLSSEKVTLTKKQTASYLNTMLQNSGFLFVYEGSCRRVRI